MFVIYLTYRGDLSKVLLDCSCTVIRTQGRKCLNKEGGYPFNPSVSLPVTDVVVQMDDQRDLEL